VNWTLLGLVMAGGAIGAGMRHLLGGWLLRQAGEGWPWGTLASNLIGSFAIGFLFAWLQGRGPAALYWRAFLVVGVLGALTTWSSLMLETLVFARTGRTDALFAYFATTLVSGIALVWAGARLGEWLRG
jgi:CrcB protein